MLHVEPLIHTAGIEDKLVRRDGKQRPCHLRDSRQHEVLQILTCQHEAGVALACPFQGVADILNGDGIGKPDMKLIQHGHCVALCQKFVVEVGQDIEQHGVLHLLVGITEQVFHAENQKTVRDDIGVSIEEPALGATAHGMQSEQDVPQRFPRIQRVTFIVVLIRFLEHIIQVRKNRVVCGLQAGEVGAVIHLPFSIQPLQHQLNGVDLLVAEIPVRAEEVLQKRDMLRQPGCGTAIRIPQLRLQWVDTVFAAHQVNEAAVQLGGQVRHLMLRVQADNGFAGLPNVAHQELQQVTLALARIAQNEDTGVRLVAGPAVQIHQNVCAKTVFSYVESLGVCFAGVIHGIQVCHRRRGQDTLKGIAESVLACRIGGPKAVLLPQKEGRRTEFAPHQFGCHAVPQSSQFLQIFSNQLQKYGAVEQWLIAPVFGSDDIRHILQIGFRCQTSCKVVCLASLHAVFVAGVVEDSFFLRGRNMAGVDLHRHIHLFSKVLEQSHRLRGSGIVLQCHNAAVCPTADEMVGVELDRRRSDEV